MNDIVTATRLAQGALIEVKVTARNIKGSSVASDLNTSGVTVKVKPQTPTDKATRGSATNGSQIVVNFGPLSSSFDGGSPITSYILEMLVGTQWTRVGTTGDSLTTTATITSPEVEIVLGQQYTFRWSAKNIFGTSNPSPTTDILAANEPAQMDPPTLTLSNTYVVITWVAPNNRGSAITKYRVTFLDKADNTYKEVESFCGLSESSHTTGTTCAVPMAGFGTILGYSKGELLKVKVQAYNVIGYSTPSNELTTGLVFQGVPESVTNLSAQSTARDTVVITWDLISSSPNNGYSPVTSYNIYHNGGGGTTYTKVRTSTTSTATFAGLTNGSTYSFKVSGVNKHGEGTASTPVSILVALIPGQMTAVTTTEQKNVAESKVYVKITWTLPETNGSPIDAYRVKFFSKLTSSYSELSSLCNGANPAVVSARE